MLLTWNNKTRIIRLALLSVLTGLAIMVYLPGLSGPWLFDDFTNIIHNNFIRISTLNFDTLWHAAFSIASGPLERPVAMLSFALNYFFAGSFDDTVPYKLTNVILHTTNGILVFWITILIVSRLNPPSSPGSASNSKSSEKLELLAGSIALLWVLHPIQVTSVLYVVQRMAELSATFVLLGLICYVKGRNQVAAGKTAQGFILLIIGPIVFGALGIYSKENAILLCVFIPLLEFFLFADEPPWRNWPGLSPRAKLTFLTAGITAIAILFFMVLYYSLPGYAGRPFTFSERLLTEPRALFFYLSLLVVPRIDQFALYHDDFPTSISLLTPWSTLPALLGIIGLLVIALPLRKRFRLLSLGIAWFFAGHLLESTIFPLELIHEHRNYLASLGIMIVLVELIRIFIEHYRQPWYWIAVPVLVLFFGGATYARTSQWSTNNSFYAFEALHHPDSGIAQSGLGGTLVGLGRYSEAEKAFQRSSELDPKEPSHLIWLSSVWAKQRKPIDPQVQQRIVELLSGPKLSATTIKTLGDVAGCVQTWCHALRSPMEEWLRTLLDSKHVVGDKSYYHYLLGITLMSQNRVNDAIMEFWASYTLDPKYLHPLINLASIYVQSSDLKNAESVLSKLQQANKGNPHALNQEVGRVELDVKMLRENQSLHTTTPLRKPHSVL